VCYSTEAWNRTCIEEADRYRRAMIEGRKDPSRANPEICEEMMDKWLDAIDRKQPDQAN
jgi:hypothetical protein